ncbi:MAG: hypothetical protein NZM10_00140 [Fimbriimonadales bacterium]|nr:hypothetical protein [Fimbriimonadales bacterium]
MILLECLHFWLRRYGEPFEASAQSVRGLFFQPPGGLLRWHFSPEELTELPRPLWTVVVTPSVNLPPNTQLIWRGNTYRVLRTLEFRLDATPIYRLLLIAPVG